MHITGLRVGNEHRDAEDNCRAIKEALACNKIDIDSKQREGWNPQVPGPPARWPADKVAWVACGRVIIM